MSSVRIDSWITAVRLVKTRSLASDDCKAGRVSLNGSKAKPSQLVQIGDTVSVRRDGNTRIVEVTRLIAKRVGAAVAVECYVDKTPVAPPTGPTAAFAVRDRGAGRPTKRERREIGRLTGR
ncbi:RNA-binding S4 domain-containing protein [Mycetocola reblochoni]|uniref:RNA-binding S4 domain-containing protein n=1 Tax=Mycetocola reblochoni TaxID=331618 RepID=A0A3L6ZP75_9MICO|nr:RNA-binding S4 domain-containing protein [Mycetocola reblochoni]